jgi:copper chaperone
MWRSSTVVSGDLNEFAGIGRWQQAFAVASGVLNGDVSAIATTATTIPLTTKNTHSMKTRPTLLITACALACMGTSGLASDASSGAACADTTVQTLSQEQTAGSSTKVVLNVTGMTCGACVKGVKSALTSVEGVTAAEVDLTAGTATVTCEAGKVQTSTLTEAVTKAGYTVAVVE